MFSSFMLVLHYDKNSACVYLSTCLCYLDANFSFSVILLVQYHEAIKDVKYLKPS